MAVVVKILDTEIVVVVVVAAIAAVVVVLQLVRIVKFSYMQQYLCAYSLYNTRMSTKQIYTWMNVVYSI